MEKGIVKVSNIMDKHGKVHSYNSEIKKNDFDNWDQLISSNMVNPIKQSAKLIASEEDKSENQKSKIK